MLENVVGLILIAGIGCDESLVSKFKQNDYKIEFERADVVGFNKEVVKDFRTVTFKFNRTTTTVNVTITYRVDIGYNIQVHAQVYKFMSNEYRYFPLELQLGYCSVIANNLLGLATAPACDGLVKKCPLLKNREYRLCNWVPDEKMFPPLMPVGRYRVDVQAYHLNRRAWALQGHGRVYHKLAFKQEKRT